MSSTNVTFRFPVKRLENSRVVLEPFDVWKHVESFLRGCKDHPELFDYLPYGPFASIAEFEAFYTDRVLPNSAETLFAILAKASPSDESGTLAGVVGLLNASPTNASIEIGFVSPDSGLVSDVSSGLNLTESNRLRFCLRSRGHM